MPDLLAAMVPMNFREIGHASPEYRQELALRDEVLRRPLGLVLEAGDVAADDKQFHFGLFDAEGSLTACVVAVPATPFKAKIRQMAVAPAHQGLGLGRHLMEELEQELRARGFREFELHARRSAEGFYQRLGYTTEGGEFTEVTIPHVKMVKN
jgi:ribosomal protein S18 acetylase RimI-like enzyme